MENNIDELKRMISNYEGVLNVTPVKEAYIARGLIKDIDLCKWRLMEEIGLGDEYDG
ncbi:hypothetical protein [Lactobacillus amylolyticus]|uniref:hypothetical protein n=1 Tax=Lactobacillus amylolyticus TaxID=83683 RepID=UPI002492118E|nr:hypothetical protein [Lactobacillus amylolyticus]